MELFYDFDKTDLLRLAEILIRAAATVLFILLVARPLVLRAVEIFPSVATEGRAFVGQVTGGLVDQHAGQSSDKYTEEEFEKITSMHRSEIPANKLGADKAGKIIAEHPEKAVSVLRSWMNT